MSTKLRIGDQVMWSGAWGSESSLPARVTSIELAEDGKKYGEEVEEVLWKHVDSRNVVVDLDNGNWAYGNQLTRIL